VDAVRQPAQHEVTHVVGRHPLVGRLDQDLDAGDRFLARVADRSLERRLVVGSYLRAEVGRREAEEDC
jgi:hypothetical protein